MNPAVCPICGAGLAPNQPGKHETMRLSGPWQAEYRVARRRCYKCGTPVKFMAASFMHGQIIWSDWGERMVVGEDYVQVCANKRRPGIASGAGCLVYWAWHPMAQAEAWDRKIIEHLRQDDELRTMSTICPILILPPTTTVPLEEWPLNLFSEVWQLQPKLLQGSVGPYPSLRAERSILITLGQVNLLMVRHFWPSVTFPVDDYIPMADNEELTREWSRYARSHIQVST